MKHEEPKIPWTYISLSQVMASVRSDLALYDEANMIDDDDYIKVVAKCNEKLGERIYKSKQCRIIVENYQAPLPSDMWKIENIFAISTNSSGMTYAEGGGILGATQVIHDNKPAKMISDDKIIPVSCGKNSCCDDYYVSMIDRKQAEIMFKNIIPLILGSNLSNKCADYSPCTRWKGQYQADIDNDRFNFSFRTGEIFVSYLGDMTDENGELVIPRHPLLNDYYEYSIKERIYENLFNNSEADVINKLKYTSEKRQEAYYDAFNYVQTPQVGQWERMRKQREMEYYTKWYSMFD